jgi:hypothetical protein
MNIYYMQVAHLQQTQTGHPHSNLVVPQCKKKKDANIMVLGTMIPAPANAGLNLDDNFMS